MSARRGVQAEVLLSLAVVMLTALSLLAAVFLKLQTAQLESSRERLGRSLLADTRAPGFRFGAVNSEGALWWVLEPDGAARALSRNEREPHAEARSLADAVREDGRPRLALGAAWEPVWFAAPLGGRDVAVAWMPPAVPALAVLSLGVLDAVVFVALGGYVLRRRVIAPLQALRQAAHEIGEGGLGTRVVVEGADEVAGVASAFNVMSEALAGRTQALEKAVADLRATNEDLRLARVGLDRAERLAAVGSLAAGVAHEVGNPMGAMLAFVDLARREGERDGLGDTGREHLKRAAREGERVRVILRQLLDFSRPPRPAQAPVDLLRVAEQAASLLRAQRRYESVEITIRSEGEPPTAFGDESVAAQILLNLVINAADAVRERDGARVELTLRPAPLRVRSGEGGEGAAQRRALDAVECEVADNGPGVPAAERERIFDPFYTTKPPGEGTGLGLANALRLAEEIGGALSCGDSAELGGASFALRLPCADAREGTGEGGVARVRSREASRSS